MSAPAPPAPPLGGQAVSPPAVTPPAVTPSAVSRQTVSRQTGSQPTESRTSLVPWVLSAVTMLALVLRLFKLNSQLWFDEIVAVVNSVRGSAERLLTEYFWDNQHTLHDLLAQASVAVFGEEPWTVRLPAVLAGVACVPALYWFCRLVLSRGESLAAATLLAVSYHHVFFSQNARGYTLLLLATILASWCFLEGLRTQAWRWWIGYAVTVALGSYTHLTMILVGLGHALLVVALMARASYRRESQAPCLRAALGICGSGLLTLALYGPMLLSVIKFFTDEHQKVDSEWTNPLWAAAETLRNLRAGYGWPALSAAALLVGAGAWTLLRQRPLVVAVMAAPPVVCVAVVLAMQHHVWPRFLFPAFGFALLVVVRGARTLAEWLSAMRWPLPAPVVRRTVFAGILTVVFLGSLWSLQRAYALPKQDYLSARAFVEAERRPQDAVATVGLASLPYRDFYESPWTVVETPADLAELRARGNRTWVVVTFLVHLKSRYPEISDELDRDFEIVRTFPATVPGGEITVLCSRGKRLVAGVTAAGGVAAAATRVAPVPHESTLAPSYAAP